MFEEQDQPPPSERWRWLLLCGGVILPAVSLCIEATTHMCAETFFDPLPTLWHVLLVAFVPITNLQAWLALRRGRPVKRAAWLGLSNAAALGVGVFYSIVYLPLVPLALVALVFMGLGVLPLTPYFALIAGLVLRRRLKRLAGHEATTMLALRPAGLLLGLAGAALAVVLADLPVTLSHAGMKLAASESPRESARGLRLLRAWGDEDYLLRSCYYQTGRTTDLIGYLFSLGSPATPQQAREVYYRLKGVSFDSVPPPPLLSGKRRPADEFDFDTGQGGEAVGGRLKNLTLTRSHMDSSLDTDAALGYLEWTLVFRNDADAQREARAQVRLPPGGVVSRLTLWVNGEEREAAFAGRGQVRQAYENVVRTRRDPVLVTTSGRDNVLVQCFPVPPGGGEMKIRLGITMPLILEDRERTALRLPYFHERN
ncbi:MAG: VIT domain-containing protein, partial [Pyrinomonadaceae bacterium]